MESQDLKHCFNSGCDPVECVIHYARAAQPLSVRCIFEVLIPDTIDLMATMNTGATLDPQRASLKSPAFNNPLTTTGADCIFGLIAGHITGVHVFEAGLQPDFACLRKRFYRSGRTIAEFVGRMKPADMPRRVSP